MSHVHPLASTENIRLPQTYTEQYNCPLTVYLTAHAKINLHISQPKLARDLYLHKYYHGTKRINYDRYENRYPGLILKLFQSMDFG